MTAYNAIRFLHHEAALCRGRDQCEMLCLLLPALLDAFDLGPMEDLEAAAFRYELKLKIRNKPFQDDTDRADARPVFIVEKSTRQIDIWRTA